MRCRLRKFGVRVPSEAVVEDRGGKRLETELVDGTETWEVVKVAWRRRRNSSVVGSF